MLTHEAAQALITVPIVGSWVAAAVIFRRTPVQAAHAISMHSAQTQSNLTIFAITLGINALCYAWVATAWLMPHFDLSPTFAIVAILAATCMIITGLIPAREGRHLRLHNLAAYSMALLMPVILILLAFGPTTPNVLKIISAMVAALMIFLFGLFLFVPATRQQYLWYQSAYLLCFQLTTLFAVSI